MDEAYRARLRGTFNEVAELYDQVRPGYPPQMFDDLTELAGVGPGCRVLEIGCGTGQATAPLAERGCRVIALELGTELAAIARRNLADFPRVEVVTSAFEHWLLPEDLFDLVVSATAFHWIDPAVRVTKAADALKRGGLLATVATHHIAGGSDAFFAEFQDCYERFFPSTPPGFRLPTPADIPTDSAELDSSDRFGPVAFHRYERELTYSAADYVNLLRTYSNHQALGAVALDGLSECLTSLIEQRHGGRVTMRYLTELRTARRA